MYCYLLFLVLSYAHPIFHIIFALYTFSVYLFLFHTSSFFHFYNLFKHLDHTKFPQLNLIHSIVYISMLSSSVNLLHHVLCLFVGNDYRSAGDDMV